MEERTVSHEYRYNDPKPELFILALCYRCHDGKHMRLAGVWGCREQARRPPRGQRVDSAQLDFEVQTEDRI